MNKRDENILIAEFMGCKQVLSGFHIPERIELQRIPYSYNCEDVDLFLPKDLKYSSSWDWLMPVVQEIQSLIRLDEKAKSWFEEVDPPYIRWIQNDLYVCGAVGDVYRDIVGFIVKYNEHVKS